MSGDSRRRVSLQVDAANPGEFLACCGLLEIAERLFGCAEAWFGPGLFHLATDGSLREILEALTRESPKEITHLENGPPVGSLLAPLRLSLTTGDRTGMVLDAWVRLGRENGGVVAIANRPWNFWSGQQTPLRIWNSLRRSLVKDMAKWAAEQERTLLRRRVPLAGRFGFDPGAAWNALDAGFSPNAQKVKVASSPAVELLAAVGLQRFRPVLSPDRSTFLYATWGQPLSVAVAAAAASCAFDVPPLSRFRGRVFDRGNYSALGQSTTITGVTNE